VTEVLLELEELDAFYGTAQALEGVSFSMGQEAVSVIGRNGMGKTTLCNSLMGVEPPNAHGSARFRGKELLGLASYKIAGLGIAYVPQGRRLFESLTTDEHLKMIKTSRPGKWNPSAVYELFPRLAERKKVGATQLSGGEQQMLAIGRALLTNGRLLLLDEPSEGLAPIVVREIGRIVQGLKGRGLSILIVEQNYHLALAVADRVYVMSKGQIVYEGHPAGLQADEDTKRRYLGVA